MRFGPPTHILVAGLRASGIGCIKSEQGWNALTPAKLYVAKTGQRYARGADSGRNFRHCAGFFAAAAGELYNSAVRDAWKAALGDRKAAIPGTGIGPVWRASLAPLTPRVERLTPC